MTAIVAAIAVFAVLSFAAWRRYVWVAQKAAEEPGDTSPYSLTDVFDDQLFEKVPHQKGVRWLTDVFGRSARKFPHLTALQITHTGESFTFAELDARAEKVAGAVHRFLTGPDQVVAVAMPQDSWHIVACHLGILKAGGTVMFLDTTLPDALITHMLNDARPVLVLTRGQRKFRDLPTIDVTELPEERWPGKPPSWLDDPTQRLATIFYTSGTTGMPKGVECPHAGYVNLALTYADYFDLMPGMDATSLSSSLGYDGSISEMYSAWVSGCAVVMLTKEQIRSGPELVPILREAEVTVLFCPPVLLTTLTTSPENDLPYPICRYIVPAGEAFPAALVEPWTRCRRQIINTYGPTEASTDTSRQSLRPGEPITIGPPFPNVTYVLLEVGGLRALRHGEVGELCIGGMHVARGYRNLPELTAERFIDHPEFGRLYRTGDRCQIDIETQRVHFLGRIDAQLKVRGHRVEVQAVEDMLHTQFKEIEAAVVDYQNETLVAFVSAPSICQDEIQEVAPAPTQWAARITSRLAEQLPPPSVPTSIFLVKKFVMKPLSGKIDRERLPRLAYAAGSGEVHQQLHAQHVNAITEPCSANKQAKRFNADADANPDPAHDQVLAICRAVFGSQLGADDTFVEAGGHSLLIARLAQQLQAAGWAVPVRALLSDCNTARKVADRPRALPQRAESASAPATFHRSSAPGDEAAAQVLSLGHFTARQVLFAALLYSPGMIAFLAVLGFLEIGTFFMTADWSEFILVGVFLYGLGLVMPFAILLWVMLIKLGMGGDIYKNNVRPGVYPKWSRMHLRVWCIARMEEVVLASLRAGYRSSPVMALVLRLLGARVGANLQCAQDASLSGPLDLITIEDNVAIQTGAYIAPARWCGQFLHVGPVHLESGCKIGMRAGVANDVTIGRGSWIAPFTPILENVDAHGLWEGAPARLVGRCTELKRTAACCRYKAPLWLLEALNIAMQTIASFCLFVLPTASIAWFISELLIPTAETEIPAEHFRVTPLWDIVWQLSVYASITSALIAVVTSVLVCLFIRGTADRPGLYPSRGMRGAVLMYRMQLMNRVQARWTWTVTGQYLRALAGMRFPRVGGSECDLMYNLVPELANADSQVFWSNGCFTNMLDCGAEHYKLRQLDMPRNFFSGNNCVAEHGQFPSNFLLGVSTAASDVEFRRQMRARPGTPTTVAGNPPVRFASPSFEAENKQHRAPDLPLFITRLLLFDFSGLAILPIAEGLIFALIYISLLRAGVPGIAGAPMALVLAEASLVLLCVGTKRLLVGNVWGANDSAPFWSWRHFAYFFAQDCFFVWCRGPLALCAGTVLANPILRSMGCRIGEGTIVMQPIQCFDWNAVSFGKECIVDGVLQLHSFENMMLKVKRTRIADGCSVSFGATVMGGAVMAQDTTLLPLSLVLKEMHLVAGTYQGSPAEAVSATG